MWETWVLSLGQEESPGEGNGYTLQYPCLENPMDREAWRAIVHAAAKSWTRLMQLSKKFMQETCFLEKSYISGMVLHLMSLLRPFTKHFIYMKN